MKYMLNSKPKNPIIIEGFPGFGLVGTIATEYLIKHLDAKQIGFIRLEEIPPVIAVHNGQAVEPLGIFYSKEKNIVILHALTNVVGYEWQIGDMLAKISKELKAKEIVSLEGVGEEELIKKAEPKAYYMTHSKNKKELKCGEKLTEGIIMGVTGALILRNDIKVTSFFSETQSSLPDSRAAAKIICLLDEYLNLKVDYKPLIKKAEEFESKLKGILSKTQRAASSAEKKRQTYFG